MSQGLTGIVNFGLQSESRLIYDMQIPYCYEQYFTLFRYKCDCDEGFLPSRNKTECLDIDECAINNGGCDQTCTNFKGSYLCSCENGYEPVEGQ